MSKNIKIKNLLNIYIWKKNSALLWIYRFQFFFVKIYAQNKIYFINLNYIIYIYNDIKFYKFKWESAFCEIIIFKST